MPSDEEINRVTETVIGCAFRVGNALGYGFLEKVYENALAHELTKAGLEVAQQYRIPVWYDEAQCLNYLKTTSLPICLPLNFGAKVEVRRLRR